MRLFCRHRAVIVYIMVYVCLSSQFKPGKSRGNIRIIDVARYQCRLKLVLYFLQFYVLQPTRFPTLRTLSGRQLQLDSKATPADGFPQIYSGRPASRVPEILGIETGKRTTAPPHQPAGQATGTSFAQEYPTEYRKHNNSIPPRLRVMKPRTEESRGTFRFHRLPAFYSVGTTSCGNCLAGAFPTGIETNHFSISPNRFFLRNISSNRQHCIIRYIKRKNSATSSSVASASVERDNPDSGPAIRMRLISRGTKQMSHIRRRLEFPKTALFKFLHHYRTLHFKTLLTGREFQHAVGLNQKPISTFRFWNRQVVIGYIIIGQPWILPACQVTKERH